MFGVTEAFIKLDNVGVIDISHDMNFPFKENLLLFIHLLSLIIADVLFNYLDCHHLACFNLASTYHYSKTASALLNIYSPIC